MKTFLKILSHVAPFFVVGVAGLVFFVFTGLELFLYGPLILGIFLILFSSTLMRVKRLLWTPLSVMVVCFFFLCLAFLLRLNLPIMTDGPFIAPFYDAVQLFIYFFVSKDFRIVDDGIKTFRFFYLLVFPLLSVTYIILGFKFIYRSIKRNEEINTTEKLSLFYGGIVVIGVFLLLVSIASFSLELEPRGSIVSGPYQNTLYTHTPENPLYTIGETKNAFQSENCSYTLDQVTKKRINPKLPENPFVVKCWDEITMFAEDSGDKKVLLPAVGVINKNLHGFLYLDNENGGEVYTEQTTLAVTALVPKETFLEVFYYPPIDLENPFVVEKNPVIVQAYNNTNSERLVTAFLFLEKPVVLGVNVLIRISNSTNPEILEAVLIK